MDLSAPESHIPVVDFAGWNSDHPNRQRVAQDIVAACKNVGFVYIINHSLPLAVLDEAFHWSRLFFELPMAEKLQAPHPDGWAVHRGYSWPGLEKVSQAVSADNDEERAAELREVPDIKVSPVAGSVTSLCSGVTGKLRHRQRGEFDTAQSMDPRRYAPRVPCFHEPVLLGVFSCGGRDIAGTGGGPRP